MAERITWDEYETALLIDTFWQIEKTPNRKQDLIKGLSDALRQKAVNSGVAIDEKFRNVNGITMQLFQRPDDVEITTLYEAILGFFNSFMDNTPAIMDYVKNQGTEKAADYRNNSGGNLLFRPVALTEFINAALELFNEEDETFDKTFKMLSRIPMNINETPWLGLLWDGARIINRVSRPLIFTIILYLANAESLDEKRCHSMIEGYAKALNIPEENAAQLLCESRHVNE